MLSYKRIMISIEQIKAARALLDWTQDDLAREAGLSKPMINTLERRIANPRVESMAAIQKSLEKAGVEFMDGHGVRLRDLVLKTQVFEGDDALMRLVHDIFDTLVGTGKELLVSGINEEKYRFLGGARILEEIDKRVKHGVPTKLLAREGDRNFIEPASHYRWLPAAFFPSVPTYVYDTKYAIFLWGPPQKVVLIENAEIADSFRQQFMALWEAAQIPEV